MGFADRLTAAGGGRGSWRPGGNWRPGGWDLQIDLRRQLAAGGSSSSVYRVYYCFYETDGAVVILFIDVNTALWCRKKQFYLQNRLSVLLSRSWKSSTNPVYRGYYCFYEDGKAVLLAGIVLSTALEKLDEQY